MDFQLKRFQVALFFSTLDASSRLKLASSVCELAEGQLNVDPLILPAPDNSPTDFPLVIIQNSSNGWIFQISKERADLIIDTLIIDGVEQNHVNLPKLEQVASKIFSGLEKQFSARVNRLGLIATHFAEIDASAEYIHSRYIKTDQVLEANEINFSYLHKSENNGFSINKWTRIISKSSTKPEKIILEIDINTQRENQITNQVIYNEYNLQSFFILGNELIQKSIRENS